MKKAFSKLKDVSQSKIPSGTDKKTTIDTPDKFKSSVENAAKYIKQDNFSRKDLKKYLDKITNYIREKKHESFEQDMESFNQHIKTVELAYANYKWAKRSLDKTTSTLKTAYDDVSQNYLQYLQEKIGDDNLQTTTESIKDFVGTTSKTFDTQQTTEQKGETTDTKVNIAKQEISEHPVNLESDNKTKLEVLKNNDTGEKIVSGWATVGYNKPNQDAFFVDHEHKSYAVFDGVGGGWYGDKAAAAAKDFIQPRLADFPKTIDDAKKAMKQLLLDTHKTIERQSVQLDLPSDASSTTASVVKILEDGTAVIGNAGDSRVYVLRKGSQVLEHLTLDNASASYLEGNTSSYNVQVEKDTQERMANLDTFENAPDDLKFPIMLRHGVDHVLGSEPLVGGEPDPAIYTYQLQPGDRLVLTTDGIHDNLTDKQIADCLLKNASNDQKAVDAMIEAATQVMNQYDRATKGIYRSKPDDRTAVVVEIE